MNIVSDCCGATPWGDMIETGICGDCKEHCEFINIDFESK